MTRPTLLAPSRRRRGRRPRPAAPRRDAAVAQPPAVLAHAAAPARRHGPRRRRLRRQRHDHDGHPRRHPHRRAGARLPGRQAARRPGRRRGRPVAAGTSSSACTPSSRWCAAACCSTCPARLGIRTAARPATRSPPPTSRPPRHGRAPTVDAGDVVLVRSGWGRLFDDGDRAYIGQDTGVPGVGEAGARWLADRGVHAAGADTIAFERLAPGAGHSAAARPPGAAGRARHLHRRDARPGGAGRAEVHEFIFVLVAAATLRRHRLPGPAAGGGRHELSRTLAQQLAALRRRGRRRRPARRGGRQRPRCGCWTSSGSASAASALRDQRGAPWARPRAGWPPAGARRSACPTGAGSAGGVRQRRPRALARLRRHPPAVGAAPERERGAGSARRRRAGTAPTARRWSRPSPSAWRSRCGSAWPATTPAAGNSIFFEHGQHATSICGAMGGAVAAAAAVRAGRGERDRTPSAWPPRWPSGRHRGQPHRRHRQAAALRLGRARRRRRRRAGPARLHRAAHGAGGPVRLLPGLAARRVDAGRGHRRARRPTGRCPASSSSPTRPTTSPMPPSTRPPRCGRGASAPRTSTRSSSASPPPTLRTIGEPIEVKRAPETGYMAQFSGPYAVAVGLLGGGGPGRRPRRLHRRSWPRDPGAASPDGRRSTSSPTTAATEIFPHQFPAVLPHTCTTAGPWSRRCSPTAAARSGRCRSRS